MQTHHYRPEDTVYGREQRIFAEMQEQALTRARRARRRRLLKWVLRRM